MQTLAITYQFEVAEHVKSVSGDIYDIPELIYGSKTRKILNFDENIAIFIKFPPLKLPSEWWWIPKNVPLRTFLILKIDVNIIWPCNKIFGVAMNLIKLTHAYSI